MDQIVKDDWIINSQNIFGLSQDVNLSLSSIQYEILNQIEGKDISSITDYLGAKIDISKEIRFTKNLTIEKVFEEFLGFENINPLKRSNFNCCLILNYLQLSLFKEYSENKHNIILTFSEYEKQYSALLNKFVTSNIDTDEQDFIKAEQVTCDNLIKELQKPIYSVLSPLNEVLDKACGYKKNLLNSLDKRKKFLDQKANEKYPKVKALFELIQFLHSNINNFKQYDNLVKEQHQLDKERNKLSPRKNFKDKLKYDEIQAELKEKFQPIKQNIIQPIQDKVKELNICDINKTETIWNWNISEIGQLKRNFNQKDLTEIFRHKRKYLEFRRKTKNDYFIPFFFQDLDETLKELFNYFNETETNDFETFETKSIQVNSISEAIKGFKKGQTKFTLPSNVLFNVAQGQQPQKEALQPQQTEKPKPELKLNDFFNNKVSSDTIAAIQTEFKELEGKDLAILIYLLHKEYKIIEILTNSRTKGRKGFVKCLKETDNPTMQKVNKCFVPNKDDLIYSKNDLVFQSLNKRLSETIKK